MALLTAMAIGAGILGAVSGIANTAYSHWQYKDQKQYNSAEAQKNRDWETEMSNTAYQRTTADMEAAGLNPAMMYGGGSAASTPTASSASVNANGGIPLQIQSFSSLLSSAAQVMNANKDKNSTTYQSAEQIIYNVAKIMK